jgi:hypothetical protein
MNNTYKGSVTSLYVNTRGLSKGVKYEVVRNLPDAVIVSNDFGELYKYKKNLLAVVEPVIYTSYYNDVTLPKDMRKISISQGVPSGFDGLRLIELAPSWDLVRLAKSGMYVEYTDRYIEEVLSKLNMEKLVRLLRGSVLLCYEGLDKPCHRHLCSKWFRAGGYEVIEWRNRLQ